MFDHVDQIVSQSKKATRDGFGEGLLEIGQENDTVVALCADLTGSLKMNAFKDTFPERFFQVGIAEANMMSIAAGLAIVDKIPYTGTFANFSTGRVYDQIRQSIAYSHKNVKICASHAGITLGEDGATHQILEDIGLMRMLPGMTVINTCDYHQTKWATKAIAEVDGPCYLRFGRPAWPIFMPKNEKLTIGKAWHMVHGSDVTIACTGHMVWQCVEAAKTLAKEGVSIDLLNIHTIKPLDREAILSSVHRTRCLVSAEEHNRMGGLGSAIAELLGAELPTPIEFVAVDDTFGESGRPEQLLEKYGLNPSDVVNAVHRVIRRK